jgi:hypothetical protein
MCVSPFPCDNEWLKTVTRLGVSAKTGFPGADWPPGAVAQPPTAPRGRYGLEGVLTWTIEGTATDVGPGEALCIPRGTAHHFDNTRDGDARALAIVTPGILGLTSSARWRPSSTRLTAGLPTSQRSQQ